MDSLTEPFQRRALKDQINEFGQTPKQIFFASHPLRKSRQAVDKEAELVAEIPAAPREKKVSEAKPAPNGPLKFVVVRQGQLPGVANASVMQFTRTPHQVLVVDGNQLRMYDLETNARLKAYGLNSEGVTRVCQINGHLFVLGQDDGLITVFSTKFGLTTQTVEAHKNKVTALFHLPSFVT